MIIVDGTIVDVSLLPLIHDLALSLTDAVLIVGTQTSTRPLAALLYGIGLGPASAQLTQTILSEVPQRIPVRGRSSSRPPVSSGVQLTTFLAAVSLAIGFIATLFLPRIQLD